MLSGTRLISICLCLLLPAPVAVSAQEESIVSHALAMAGVPKYPAGFASFDYVNPEAPRGGEVILSAIGTFDTFNAFIVKGAPAQGTGLIYETLTARSLDEPFSQYGSISEKIELARDRSWVVHHLNPSARFHDGRPVTAEDVVFSFYTLFEKGDPLYKRYYADVTRVEALDERRVKFHLGDKTNPELALIVGELPVLPRHYWEGKDFARGDLEIPLGSGPYRIEKFQAGRSVTYRRVADYWAKDLPVNKGQYNFDAVTYEYFRDATVALQAFKSGEYDYRMENIAKNWATQYKGPPFDAGMIVVEEIPNQVNQGMQCFAYNTRRPVFEDRRVREALAYAFDFEWTNQNMFYGQYVRSKSFFSNSELAARGVPNLEALEILEPFRKLLWPEVFEKPYEPPSTEGPGGIRQNLATAMKILGQAGWEVKKGKLTHTETGRALEFEILLMDSSFERVVLPFKKNLERLGVSMNVRTVDIPQYINRVREYDFDMIVATFAQSESPGNEQRLYWSSEAAGVPGTRNYCGIRNKAIDQLVDLVISAPDRKALVDRCRALDRALLWGHYVIPQWHTNTFRVAYWDKLQRPSVTPKYDLGFFSWWVDKAKDEKVRRYLGTSLRGGS
jgi:microcin C transport system substrate-binding protein